MELGSDLLTFATLIQEGDWVEITFAKTSGTVTEDRKNGKMRRIDPRSLCKTLTWPSFFQVSKVVNGQEFSLVIVNQLYHCNLVSLTVIT